MQLETRVHGHPQEEERQDGPHENERLAPPLQIEVGDEQEFRYELVRHYPYAGLSGWHWAVYRNKNR